MTLVGNTHIIAGGAETIPDVLALLEEEGFEVRGNPDIYVRTYTHFGIDEARELRDRAALRGQGGAQRMFIITAPGMTHEAQNALLKTFEESPGGALFFVIVPSPEMLLPTLRSRMQVLSLSSAVSAGSIDAKSFLAALPAKRLDMLKPLLEKDEDERRDIAGIIAFLSSLERTLNTTGSSVAKAMEDKREGLESVYRARKYASDKGALLKPLLEQVALLVPHV